MKIKKVLAAVLAGTMVMASASMVFASESIYGNGWWETSVVEGEDSYHETSTDYTMSGDGEWTVTVVPTEAIGDYGAYVVEFYDDNGYYLSTTSANDAWFFGDPEGSLSGANAGDSAFVIGETYYIEVVRSGGDITMCYYSASSGKFSQFRATGTNFGDDLYIHVIAQQGTMTVDYSEGLLYTNAGETGSDNTEDPDSTEETSEPASEEASEEASEAASEATTTTTSDDNNTSTTTTQTGDAAPIAAVAVALIGCAAIAFASKKRFA